MAKRKPTVQQLLKSKRRDQRKKGQRLAQRALLDRVEKQLSNRRTYANVMAIRQAEGLLFGMRTGLFGHPTTTTLRVSDEEIVGAIDSSQELGEMVTKVGLLTLAALVNYNLAWGPEGLPKKLADWAGIDVEALRAAAITDAMPDGRAAADEYLARKSAEAVTTARDAEGEAAQPAQPAKPTQLELPFPSNLEKEPATPAEPEEGNAQ